MPKVIKTDVVGELDRLADQLRRGVVAPSAYDADMILKPVIEEVRLLREVALRYEAWEAKLILSDEAWDGGMRALPEFTDDLWDEWDELLEIQALRNEAKRKAEGRV